MPQLAEVSEAGEVHSGRAKWARFGKTRKADGKHQGAIRIPDVRVGMGVGALRREACVRYPDCRGNAEHFPDDRNAKIELSRSFKETQMDMVILCAVSSRRVSRRS
jgi:hypothetical protein